MNGQVTPRVAKQLKDLGYLENIPETLLPDDQQPVGHPNSTPRPHPETPAPNPNNHRKCGPEKFPTRTFLTPRQTFTPVLDDHKRSTPHPILRAGIRKQEMLAPREICARAKLMIPYQNSLSYS